MNRGLLVPRRIFLAWFLWLCHPIMLMTLCFCAVHLSGQILIPLYLMNGLSNLDETDRQYSLVPTDDLIRFWRSKVKVTAGLLESCEHHISWSTWAVSMKLTVNNHLPLLMTRLDFGGQRSKVKIRAGCRGGRGIHRLFIGYRTRWQQSHVELSVHNKLLTLPNLYTYLHQYDHCALPTDIYCINLDLIL